MATPQPKRIEHDWAGLCQQTARVGLVLLPLAICYVISRNLEELAGFALILLIAIEAIAFFSLLTGEDNGGQSDLWWLFKATSMGAAALWSLALLAN